MTLTLEKLLAREIQVKGWLAVYFDGSALLHNDKRPKNWDGANAVALKWIELTVKEGEGL